MVEQGLAATAFDASRAAMASNVGLGPPASGYITTAGHGPSPSGVATVIRQSPSGVVTVSVAIGMLRL